MNPADERHCPCYLCAKPAPRWNPNCDNVFALCWICARQYPIAAAKVKP